MLLFVVITTFQPVVLSCLHQARVDMGNFHWIIGECNKASVCGFDDLVIVKSISGWVAIRWTQWKQGDQ